jgi:hypothetical protein
LGRWLRTVVQDRKQETATGTETIDLPKANFLAKILVRIFNVSGTTPTFSLDKVEVIANGSSVVWSTRGDQLSRQMFYHYGMQKGNSFDVVSTGDSTGGPFFGRQDRDTFVVFPAKLFRTLQLKLSFTLGGTTPVYNVSVVADEWISDDDPTTKLIMKTVFLEEKASGAATKDYDLPLGNLFKQFQIFVTTAPTVSNKVLVSLRINGGAEIPYSMDYQALTNENAITKNLDSSVTMANDAFVDFDYDGSLADVKDSALYNDLKFRTEPGAFDPGTARLVTTELVRLK